MKTLLFVALLAQAVAVPQTTNGIVSGRIRGMDGTPAAGIRIAAVAVAEANASPTGAVLASLTQSDSSGNYRLENIPPGRYYIMAGLVDLPTYFPGVTSLNLAEPVTVTTGAAVPSIDFSMMRPANIRVAGRLVGLAEGSLTPRNARVALLSRSGGGLLNTLVNSDGTFEFPNVLPGTFTVQLLAPTLILKQPMTVTVIDRDLTGVELAVINTLTVTRRQGLEDVWSLDGSWAGIASDEKTGALYASEPRGVLAQIDYAGKIQRETPGLGSASILRLARFSENGAPVFLAFGTWSREVRAVDSTGKQLWSYPNSAGGPPTGIDDVWPMDLNGDKADEVIVGFNGGTGIHVLDSQGQLLWKSNAIGNVWHVSAGDVRGDGKPLVISTSASGRVHLFSADGSEHRDLKASFYANMVRAGKLSEKDPAATIVVSGGAATATAVAALSGDGVQKWSLELPSGPIFSAFLAAGKPWMALGTQGGQVFVVDVERGAVIANIDGQGISPDVAWLGKGGEPPLLIVSTRGKLSAFRLENK